MFAASKILNFSDTVFLGTPGKVAVAIMIISISIFYSITKPLPIPPDLPGPKRYPWIGYLWHPLKYWHIWPTETTKLAKIYKRTWGGPLPNFGGLPGAYFYIHDEENFRHILQTKFSNYVKGGMWKKVLGEILGVGIFAVDGERWHVHRKLMSNMFSRNLLRHSAEVTRKKLSEVVHVFNKRIDEADDAEEGFDIDLQDVFFRLTIDITTIITFGIDLCSIQRDQQHHFALAFDELSFLCQKRFLDPFFQVKKVLRLTRNERRIRELKEVVDEFAFDVIARKRRLSSHGSPLGLDLLSRFVEYGRQSNEEISDSELRDVVMNVILAGRDTTACALSWLFFELTRNKDVVEKIIEEVELVCGVGENADYSYDRMGRLKYCHCVALETLRLHPSVTNDPRYAVKHDILPDGTKVPAGAGIDLCFYSILRKEDVWGLDALEFKPERFLDEKEPSPFKYPVFHAGPRTCLGRPLALMNMKLAMSILVTSFKFHDQSMHSGEYTWTLVESMKGGFKVRVEKNK